MKRYHGRLKPIHFELPPSTIGLSGHIRAEAFQCREMVDGRSIEIPGTRRVAAEFDNLITNNGLDHVGKTSDFGTYCQVGTGNAAESVADTTLDTYLASRTWDTGYQNVYWAQATAPYYGAHQRRYRFQPNFGGGNVNITEIGISPQSATGDLFCRALTRSGGTPQAVPVLSTEYFDVYYTIRCYADHVNYVTGATDDGTGSFFVDADEYDYTIRAARITYANLWGRNLFRKFNLSNWDLNYVKGELFDDGARLNAVTDAMDSANGIGTSYEDSWFYTDDHTVGTYTDSTYTNTIEFDTPLTKANFSGATNAGIQGLMPYSSHGAYQVLITADQIPKTGSEEFFYTHRTSWTRKSLL